MTEIKSNNNNSDNNERISRMPFHVKHAEQVQIRTHAYKTPKTAGVQTIMNNEYNDDHDDDGDDK